MTQTSLPTQPKARLSLLPISSVLLMALVGTALAWQIITKSFADYLADLEPEWALRLAPNNSDALVDLAVQKGQPGIRPGNLVRHRWFGRFRRPAGPGHAFAVASGAGRCRCDTGKGRPYADDSADIPAQAQADVRQLARAALRNAPLDSRALRILGQVAASDDRTAAFMRTAAAHSLHETLALYWLMQKSFLDGDFAKTTSHADALLRSQPQLATFIVPLLARIAETAHGLDLVKSLLRTNPPWLPRFFSVFINSVTDTHLPLDVMLDLQTAGTPPAAKDIRSYIDYLMKKKLYNFAYYAWLQFLPPNQMRSLGLLFNGNFAFDPSGVPFDWTITYKNGVEIDILDNPDRPGHRALYWEFTEGRVDTNGVSQTVTLAPGTYSLHGTEKGDIQARRGLRWRVACYDYPTHELAESQAFLGFVSDWKEFSMDFTVPARNCPAQQIWLSVDAVSDPDRLVSGSAWFADIGLSAKPRQ